MAVAPKHVLTILAVRELVAAKSFYVSAFNWPVTVNAPAYIEFALPGGMRLGLYDREGFGRNTGQVPEQIPSGQLAPTELYFYVEEMETAIRQLTQAGARALSPLQRRDWGDEAAYFADPDGNVLVLARPVA